MRGGETLGGHVDPDVLLPFLDVFADQCTAQGHRNCSARLPCFRVRDELWSQATFDAAARAYDLGLQNERWVGMPTFEWPVAALVGRVRRGISQSPWVPDRFERQVEMTSALARLGEYGIPPDALVRRCLRAPLRRTLLTTLAAVLEAGAAGVLDLSDMSPDVADWLSLADGLDLTGKDVTIELLTGPSAQVVDAWIDSAAMTHLLSWRRDAQCVDIDPEDLALPGGPEATQWIFDRFTFTSLDEWVRSSLDWELAYTQQPLHVARRLGLAPEVLAQRPVSEAMVVRALTRRLSTAEADDHVLNGLRVGEVVENLVALVHQGKRREALALARAALQEAPDHPALANAFAFLLLPDDPEQALTRLRSLLRVPGAHTPLVRLNLVAGLICAKNLELARAELATALEGEDAAWLWEPSSLVEGMEPVLSRYRVSEWLRLARDVASGVDR